MSSATSIKRRAGSARVQADNRKPQAATSVAERLPGDDEVQEDAGFRPWHFFVLVSLIAATAAVMMSRRATPEHLIMMSLTIAAAGAAAAGFYRMLAPLAAEDVSLFSEPLTERSRAALEREKTLVLRSIKELEFDRAMGKLSPKDFDEMAGRLRSRALSLMKQLDVADSDGYRSLIERELAARLGSAPRTATRTATAGPVAAADAAACGACGTANDHDATFCKKCGTRLHAEPAHAGQAEEAR